MNARILLVDLESVQPAPTEVEGWMSDDGSAWIFHGPHQTKILPKYEALGTRVTLVPISRCGKNSLDFHLVFYLGYLTARNPKCTFAVLSRDKGYDPAITHARSLGFDLLRIDGLDSERPKKVSTSKAPMKTVAAKKLVPVKEAKPSCRKASSKSKATTKSASAGPSGKAGTASAAKANTQVLGALTRNIQRLLRAHTANRPKSLQALERYVQAHLGPEPAPTKVRTIVERLLSADAVRQEDGRLVYFADCRSDADIRRMRVSPGIGSAAS